jgi:hypothetical protein
MPAWGWVLLSLGGAAAAGTVVYVATKPAAAAPPAPAPAASAPKASTSPLASILGLATAAVPGGALAGTAASALSSLLGDIF